MTAFLLATLLMGAPDDARAGSSVDNRPCLVCHPDLEKEDLARIHLEEAIGCTDCHGSSRHHMHDEMLMTKADILYGRDEVAGSCSKCHDEHEDPAAVEAFRTKWYGRDRPNGRVINEESICTDCHGEHNIARTDPATAGRESASGTWASLFDGKGLEGWKGDSDLWSVRRRRLRAQAAPGRAGRLEHEVALESFRFFVTFRAGGRQESLLWWTRGGETFGIALAGHHPPGSLVRGGRLVISNLAADLVDPEGWNTVAVLSAEWIEVWINGEEAYRVRASPGATTRIGMTYRAVTEGAMLEVREVKVQPLAPDSDAESAVEKEGARREGPAKESGAGKEAKETGGGT